MMSVISERKGAKKKKEKVEDDEITQSDEDNGSKFFSKDFGEALFEQGKEFFGSRRKGKRHTVNSSFTDNVQYLWSESYQDEDTSSYSLSELNPTELKNINDTKTGSSSSKSKLRSSRNGALLNDKKPNAWRSFSAGDIEGLRENVLRKENESEDPQVSDEISNYLVHRITGRQTLQGLALKYGVNIADIKRVNRLWTNEELFARKELIIPISKDQFMDFMNQNQHQQQSHQLNSSPTLTTDDSHSNIMRAAYQRRFSQPVKGNTISTSPVYNHFHEMKRRELIKKFCALTGCTQEMANYALSLKNFNFTKALGLYYSQIEKREMKSPRPRTPTEERKIVQDPSELFSIGEEEDESTYSDNSNRFKVNYDLLRANPLSERINVDEHLLADNAQAQPDYPRQRSPANSSQLTKRNSSRITSQDVA